MSRFSVGGETGVLARLEITHSFQFFNFLGNVPHLTNLFQILLDPVHMVLDPYGHHIKLTSFKTSTALKFVIILQNFIKTYHRKSGKSRCDRKVTELNVEITRIRSRVNGV